MTVPARGLVRSRPMCARPDEGAEADPAKLTAVPCRSNAVLPLRPAGSARPDRARALSGPARAGPSAEVP
jgi:hypothetical protein